MARERILIVDGNIALLAMVKARLEKIGYLVEYATTGPGALDILQTKWIDLVVLANRLRGTMKGHELFSQVTSKKRYSKIPIVAERPSQKYRRLYDSKGVQVYYKKPYDINEFLHEVNDVIARKVLVLSDSRDMSESIVRSLAKYDLHIEVIKSCPKFVAAVAKQRYCLVIVPLTLKKLTAQKCITLVRKTEKNKTVPVVVCTDKKKQDATPSERVVLKNFKIHCKKQGLCSFMDNGFSKKQFLTLCHKHLTTM